MTKTLDLRGNCPECGTSWDGGSILETFKKQRDNGEAIWQGMTDEQIQKEVEKYYGKKGPHRWQRIIGIEDPNGYDGVSFWQCPDCGAMWSRFSNNKVQDGVKK